MVQNKNDGNLMSTFIYFFFFKNSMISFYSGSNTTLVFEKKNTRFYLNATEIFPVDFCILLSKKCSIRRTVFVHS